LQPTLESAEAGLAKRRPDPWEALQKVLGLLTHIVLLASALVGMAKAAGWL
jgi:hypothetical protein